MQNLNPNFLRYFDGTVSQNVIVKWGTEIKSPAIFTSHNYKNQTSILEGITFENIVGFENLNIGIGIGFVDCVFKKGISFTGIEAAGYNEGFDPDSSSIFFKNCKFDGYVKFYGEGKVIERRIKFINCELTGGIGLKDCVISHESFVISDNSIVSEIIDIQNCTFEQGIEIRKSNIDAQIRITAGNLNSLSFLKSDFKRDIYITGSKIKNDVAFNDGSYDEKINLQCIGGAGTLSIIGGIFKDTLIIEYEDSQTKLIRGFRSLHFNSCQFNNGLQIEGLKTPRETGPRIESIKLIASSKLEGDLSISDFVADNITLEGINQKATIKLENIHVNKFYIENFHNYAKLILVSIKAFEQKKVGALPSRLNIERSNLGNTHFLDFNFKSFANSTFYLINIADSTFYNVNWFSPSSVGHFDDKEYRKKWRLFLPKLQDDAAIIVDISSRREMFRQLKLACEKQRDIVQALEFKKWEMDYYKLYLKITKNRNFGDRFVLWTSRSNDYGQSWGIAVWWAFVFTFPLYALITVLGSSQVNLSPAETWDDVLITLKEIFAKIPKYFQLLNPTHDLSRIYVTANSGWGGIHIVDFIFRMLTTYFIFQIVSAFRKYLK